MAPYSTLPLVDRLVPGGLERYLSEARADGQSYQTIVTRLAEEHDISSTPPTVSAWCAHYGIAKAEDPEYPGRFGDKA